jgi:hypothetical protein
VVTLVLVDCSVVADGAGVTRLVCVVCAVEVTSDSMLEVEYEVAVETSYDVDSTVLVGGVDSSVEVLVSEAVRSISMLCARLKGQWGGGDVHGA